MFSPSSPAADAPADVKVRTKWPSYVARRGPRGRGDRRRLLDQLEARVRPRTLVVGVAAAAIVVPGSGIVLDGHSRDRTSARRRRKSVGRRAVPGQLDD